MEQGLLEQLELLEQQEPQAQQEHREPRKEQEHLQQPELWSPPWDCTRRSARLSSPTAPSPAFPPPPGLLTSTPAWLRTSLLTAPAGPDMPSLSRRLFSISSFSSPCRCRLFLETKATWQDWGAGGAPVLGGVVVVGALRRHRLELRLVLVGVGGRMGVERVGVDMILGRLGLLEHPASVTVWRSGMAWRW